MLLFKGCDVVITFSIGIENATLVWLLSRLKSTGLNIRVRHNPMTNCYQCYLTAPVHMFVKTFSYLLPRNGIIF